MVIWPPPRGAGRGRVRRMQYGVLNFSMLMLRHAGAARRARRAPAAVASSVRSSRRAGHTYDRLRRCAAGGGA
eukprot:SAG31_NODE_1876_length_7007_cov_4.001882_1_plen_72_part_10